MTRNLLNKITQRLKVYRALQNSSRDSQQRLKNIKITNILVVCYGNIYRSPFVAKILSDRLTNNYSIRSSGFHSSVHRKSPDGHIEMASQFGVDLSLHTSTRMNQELIEWADIIVLMDRHNWDHLQEYGDSAVCKSIWLGTFLEGRKKEIEDPYGKPKVEQEHIVQELSSASTELIRSLI